MGFLVARGMGRHKCGRGSFGGLGFGSVEGFCWLRVAGVSGLGAAASVVDKPMVQTRKCPLQFGLVA